MSESKEEKKTIDVGTDPRRKGRITGSIVGAVLGQNTFRGQFEAALSIFQLDINKSDENTEAGHTHEAGIGKLLQEDLSKDEVEVYRPPDSDDFIEHPTMGFFAGFSADFLVRNKQGVRVAVGEAKWRASVCKLPVCRDRKEYKKVGYVSQSEWEADCAQVPVTYLIVATDVDHVVFPIQHDSVAWWKEYKKCLFEFFARFILWYITGDSRSLACMRALLEEENRISGRETPIDIDAVLKQRAPKDRVAAFEKKWAEDEEFRTIVNSTDFKELPEPKIKPQEERLFTMTAQMFRALMSTEGDDYTTHEDALRQMLDPLCPKKEFTGKGVDEKHAILKKKFGEEVVFEIKFVRSKTLPFLGGWINNTVKGTGDPVLIYWDSRAGKNPRGYLLNYRFSIPAQFIANFLIPPKRKVHVLVGNEHSFRHEVFRANPNDVRLTCLPCPYSFDLVHVYKVRFRNRDLWNVLCFM
jgi:hypothetical protein